MKVQAKQLVDDLKANKDLALIDVRTPAEFGEIHIEGAHLMPLDRLDPDVVRATAGGSGECVLICHSGKRAEQAYQKLTAAGLGNLRVLDGGVMAWDESGLPVNRGQKVMSLERQVRIAAGAMLVLFAILGFALHPGFHAMAAFVGLGLILAGATEWCGMAMILAKMPWNQRCGVKCVGSSCSI